MRSSKKHTQSLPEAETLDPSPPDCSPRQPGLPRSSFEILEEALSAEDPIQADAARARARAQAGPELVRYLTRALEQGSRRMRRRAERLLWELPTHHTRPALIELARDCRGRAARTRVAATRMLTAQATGEEALLGELARDPEPRVRRAALGAATPAEALVAALGDEDGEVVARAAEWIRERADEVDVEAVRAILERDSCPPVLLRTLAAVAPDAPAVRAAAARGEPDGLDHVRDPELLEQLLGSEHRLHAAWALVRAPQLSRRIARRLAGDPDPRIRGALARALPADHALLEALREDPDPDVAWLARANLAGDFNAEQKKLRRTHHARSSAPSAQAPYGLRDTPGTGPPRLAAALALCQTRLDVNLGAAVRSAEAAGLCEVFLVGREALSRAAARGTELVIPVHAEPDPPALVRTARERGYQLVAIQQSPASRPYHLATYPPRPLFLAGAEAEGLPLALREAADLIVEIPQFGVIDSLNVASAVAVVLFHWRTQCRPSGSGEEP